MNPQEMLDPGWQKSRIVARILVKQRLSGKQTQRDRRIARLLCKDEAVTNELIHEAIPLIEVDFISRRWAARRHVENEPAWLKAR